jgi:hypothetical protein
MASPTAHTLLKALLLAVTIALATAARAFPVPDPISTAAATVAVAEGRALLEYDEGADDTSELGNSNETVELESHAEDEVSRSC